MVEQINDIWNEKYGISYVSNKITIRPSDNLGKKYCKTAKFIYRNGKAANKFTDKDELDALKPIVKENYFDVDGYKNVSFNKIDYSNLNSIEQNNLPKTYGINQDEFSKYHFYQVQYDVTRKGQAQHRSKLIMVDPKNRAKGDQRRYRWVSTLYNRPKNEASKNGFIKYNQDLLIGNHLLKKDMLRHIKSDKKYLKDEQATLHMLSDPQYSKKAHDLFWKKSPLAEVYEDVAHPATIKDLADSEGLQQSLNLSKEDTLEILDDTDKRKATAAQIDKLDLVVGPRMVWSRTRFDRYVHDNHFLDQINNYLESTYNLALQSDFDRQTNSKHAKYFQTKKQIKKATQKRMDILDHEWSDYVKKVELDNEVDLDKLKRLEPQIKETFEALPRGESGRKPALRFRKLRNHNALGMYTPLNDTMAVDFRPDDRGGVALRSFVHEYGHFLDYNSGSKFSRSLSPEFSHILHSTQHEVANLSDKTVSEHQKEYLTVPTEVFARGFELYVEHCGLKNSLIDSKKNYEKSPRYTTFAPETRKEMYSYFDKEFPDIKRNIELLNKREREKEQAKQAPGKQTTDKVLTKNDSVKKEYKTLAKQYAQHAEQLELF